MASTLHGLHSFRGKNYAIHCIVSNLYLYSVVPPINAAPTVSTAGNGGLVAGVVGGVIGGMVVIIVIAVAVLGMSYYCIMFYTVHYLGIRYMYHRYQYAYDFQGLGNPKSCK